MMTLILNSSLPRSGSTLLQNLLSQNPQHHCTSTNDLLDQLVRIRDSWMGGTGFIAQGLAKIEPRMKAFLRHGIYGFYADEFAAGKTVFDKSRGWLSQIELIEQILERPMKIVVTVRDICDVLASFEKIFRRSAFTDHPVQGEESFQRLTVTGRAERLLDIKKTVGYLLACLQDVYARGLENRLVIVPYYELTHHPIETIKRVCFECGIPGFACDPANVPNTTQEDDTVYGMKLHTTRPVVEPDKGQSWRGILPDDLTQRIEAAFPLVQELSRRRYIQDSVAPSQLRIA